MAKSDNSTCLELALEGVRLNNFGEHRSGIAFLEAALRAGSTDKETLSIIYSQLGNAYFSLGDFEQSMNCHSRDLSLAREMENKLAEAKASGNLGNTLKAMGQFEAAIACCTRHLDITTELGDKCGQARAHYNLGNAYHVKSKQMGKVAPQDPGEYPQDVQVCLLKALEHYLSNLDLVRECEDRSAEGRVCGNLGNVHYLLGDFDEAIAYHEKRLEIAKDFGDKNAQRRAYANLGNAQIFSGNFETAIENHKKSLLLSQELGERALEAQSCYSLGNTYTLLKDYPKAIEYHLRHLQIAQQLQDKIGEGRAFWSLGNAHTALGELEDALICAKHHFVICKELGDEMGEVQAQLNVSDLKKILGHTDDSSTNLDLPTSDEKKYSTYRRKSMEEMNLIRMTPDGKLLKNSKYRARIGEDIDGATGGGISTSTLNSSGPTKQQRSLSVGQVLYNKPGPGPPPRSLTSTTGMSRMSRTSEAEDEEEGEEQDAFFDLLTKCQAERMDDQRCRLPQQQQQQQLEGRCRATLKSTGSLNQQNHMRVLGNKDNKEKKSKILPARAFSVPMPGFSKNTQQSVDSSDDLLDLIWGMQSKRMDEQRASLPESSSPDEKFFDMLIRSQSSRLEDQRSILPEDCALTSNTKSSRGTTVPDEDFLSMIARLQQGRMDDQRADIKDKNRNKIN